jgi:hypothetical protein
MRVGFVMLAHQDLDRAAQVAAYWAQNDCPVVIHVDARTDDGAFEGMKTTLAPYKNIRFTERRSCDWGKFSIVAATQQSSEILLRDFPEVGHVFLASGSCLPLKPVHELDAYLAENAETDFIESVTTEEVVWTVGGLDLERFTLRFPFSFKKRRRLFDRYVDLQRRIGYSRRIPKGVEPHLGSQWWCLTRKTLEAILTDPDRPSYDRYFSRVWIPDEAYFQSLVRKHSQTIESRSLTLARFDTLGKPHVFYDDHLQLLQRSDSFVARKIWPRANKLYHRFLGDGLSTLPRVEPNPRKLERIFARSNEQRTRGRPGLRMQSRFPTHEAWNLQRSCAPYSIYQGFNDIFLNWQTWMEKRTGTRVHGHLFDKTVVQFSGGAEVYNGCLSNSAKLRDYNPEAFLANLVWNTQGEHQSFQFGPADVQEVANFFAFDQNASVFMVTGAWAIPLFHSDMNFQRIRRVAARYQATEAALVRLLGSDHVRSGVRIWTLSEFVEEPVPILQSILDRLDPGGSRKLTEVPKMADLAGFGQFVQRLKNEGMNPHSVGDFPVTGPGSVQKQPLKPYIVR